MSGIKLSTTELKAIQKREMQTGNYTVGEIVEERSENGRREYHVKWKHFPMTQASWEPVEALEGCDALNEWQVKQNRAMKKGKERKRKAATPDGLDSPLCLSSSDDDSDTVSDVSSFDYGTKSVLPLKGHSKSRGPSVESEKSRQNSTTSTNSCKSSLEWLIDWLIDWMNWLYCMHHSTDRLIDCLIDCLIRVMNWTLVCFY